MTFEIKTACGVWQTVPMASGAGSAAWLTGNALKCSPKAAQHARFVSLGVPAPCEVDEMRVSDLIVSLQLQDPNAQVVMRDESGVARVHILTPVKLRAFERNDERWLGQWNVPLPPREEHTIVADEPLPGVILE